MSSKTFTDKRGTITDLVVTPDYSITHITFKKGAIRGNHYHKRTRQVDLVLTGSLFVAQDKHRGIVLANQMIVHPKGTKHAYKALKKSSIVSICFGVRKGTDYEKDTYRLSEEDKLIK